MDTCPSQSTALPLLQGFYLSTRSTVMCPLSQSMVEICFTTLGFSDFNSQPSHSLETLLIEVHRFLPHVLLKSTVLVHFGTTTFRRFNSSTLACSQSISPGVHDLTTCVPLNRMVEAYFGPLPKIHRNMPRLLWIRWPRSTSDDLMLDIYSG
jgi:hypothetical protein